MNKKEVGKRFGEFVKAIGLKQIELAEKMGVPQQYIPKMKTGKLSIEPYLNVFYELGLNLDWLYFGLGEMLSDSKRDTLKKEKIKILSNKRELINQQIEELERLL